jgi:hypothetical protein
VYCIAISCSGKGFLCTNLDCPLHPLKLFHYCRGKSTHRDILRAVREVSSNGLGYRTLVYRTSQELHASDRRKMGQGMRPTYEEEELIDTL